MTTSASIVGVGSNWDGGRGGESVGVGQGVGDVVRTCNRDGEAVGTGDGIDDAVGLGDRNGDAVGVVRTTGDKKIVGVGDASIVATDMCGCTAHAHSSSTGTRAKNLAVIHFSSREAVIGLCFICIFHFNHHRLADDARAVAQHRHRLNVMCARLNDPPRVIRHRGDR